MNNDIKIDIANNIFDDFSVFSLKNGSSIFCAIVIDFLQNITPIGINITPIILKIVAKDAFLSCIFILFI